MTIRDWPSDTKERIEKMRQNKYTWQDIALYFGISTVAVRFKAKSLNCKFREQRDYTPEEDAQIRHAYINLDNIQNLAAKIGRSYGSVRQRLNNQHHDLMNTVRTSSIGRAVNTYGKETLLAFDQDFEVAKKKLMEAKTHAKAIARTRAIEAKAAQLRSKFDLADKDLAEGKDRNEVIFELRAQGIVLEAIAQHFGITRERVRQIFDQVATKKAYESAVAANKDAQS